MNKDDFWILKFNRVAFRMLVEFCHGVIMKFKNNFYRLSRKLLLAKL